MERTPVAPPWPGQRPAAKLRAPFAPGKPLTTNPPHPFIKAADAELVLRGMAYGTRKSYGQHLSLILLLALSIAAAFAFLSDHNSRAASLCVNPGGTGGCYASIQAAIDAASPGDTINIAAGQYTAGIPIQIIKTLTLQGAGSSTIINITDPNYIEAYGPTTLSDLTVHTMSWTGIRVDGSATLRNIVVTGNTWGIYNYGGIITATNVAVYTRDGLVCNMNGTATISNSVITTLTRWHPLSCINVTLINDTIIGVVSLGNVVTATNSIFAGGCVTFFPAYINSLGHNIDAGNTCGVNETGDMTITNPMLTPLVMVNGMLVNALQPGSPAIDKGDDATCPVTDATGFPRPYGAHCDIGAYEWRPMSFYFSFLPLIVR